jgi:Domain of unknown function (DUF4192)
MDNLNPQPLPRVRLGSPADVLAAVPHLLGFHPASSLVVIGAGGPRDRVRVGFRYDLPDPPDGPMAAEIARHAVAVLGRQRLTTVIVVGYGPGRLVTPLADTLAAAFRQARLTVREMLRAEDGRYWSYLCSEPACCPADGVPYDPGCHPVAATMTAAGMPAYPDRAALARTLDPVTGPAADQMRAAISRAFTRAGGLVAQAATGGSGGASRLLVAAGRDAVREVIAAYRAGSAVTDDQFAWLAVALTDLRVRDDAWARMDPGLQEAHLRLWTDVVRRAEPALVPAPATLLAFVAWQAGNGALAGVALDRALAADPGYSLALLLRDVIEAGVPPAEARLPMTPEEVAESYEREARRRERQEQERQRRARIAAWGAASRSAARARAARRQRGK